MPSTIYVRNSCRDKNRMMYRFFRILHFAVWLSLWISWFVHIMCSSSVLKAIISHLACMQTTCRYTVPADLLMLIVCRTVCLYAWMPCRAGWLLTGCSLTTARPRRCSGAHRHVASTTSLIVPFVLEAQRWILYLLCATFWSCWIPGSPWARTSLQSSKQVSRHCDWFVVCAIRYHVVPWLKHWWSVRSITVIQH